MPAGRSPCAVHPPATSSFRWSGGVAGSGRFMGFQPKSARPPPTSCTPMQFGGNVCYPYRTLTSTCFRTCTCACTCTCFSKDNTRRPRSLGVQRRKWGDLLPPCPLPLGRFGIPLPSMEAGSQISHPRAHFRLLARARLADVCIADHLGPCRALGGRVQCTAWTHLIFQPAFEDRRRSARSWPPACHMSDSPPAAPECGVHRHIDAAHHRLAGLV